MKARLLFISRKTLRLILLLIVVSIASFALVEASPVDPVQAYIGPNIMKVSPEKRAEIEDYWGANDPAPTRFFKWSAAILKGDFGDSLIYKRPVLDVIGEKFKASIALMATAWVISGILGFFLAILSGRRQGTLLDKGIKAYCYVLLSTPTFWLCMLLIIIFSVNLKWFPIALGTPIGVLQSEVTIWDSIHHMILPAATLSLIGVASITLHTRRKLVDVMSTDYVLFAKARGETQGQIIKNHGMRNILLPFISLQFLSFSELFAGAVITEKVFSYPGLGQATIDAGLKGDVPLLLGIVIFTSIFIFAGNLVADILYSVIDPRIKKGVTL